MINLLVIIQDNWDKAFFEAQKHLFRSQHIEIIGFSNNSAEASTHYEKLQPDVLIMPFTMPGKSALTVARLIKNKDPNAKLLIVMKTPIQLFTRLIFEEKLGNLISREATMGNLIEAIQKSQTNDAYFFEEHTHYFVNEIASHQNPDLFNELSHSEWDVFIELLQNKTIRIIAKDLNVKPETIYSHRRQLFKKLKISDEKEFLCFARKQHITL